MNQVLSCCQPEFDVNEETRKPLLINVHLQYIVYVINITIITGFLPASDIHVAILSSGLGFNCIKHLKITGTCKLFFQNQ